ncbi:MAG: MFS transporter [Pseudomonadota bacterium]
MTTAAPSPAPSAEASSYRWYVLSVLLVVYMLNFLDRQIFAVLQEQIRADLGFSDLQLGLLGGTMFAVFYAIAGLPIAFLADRTNRVRVIAVSCATWSLFTAACGLAAGFWTMALARIGVASGEAGGVSPAYSVMSDYFEPEKRGLAFGLFSIGAPLGLAFGAALGAAIAAALGWRMAFILIGLPGVALGLWLALTVREPRRGAFDSPASQNAAITKPRPLDAARAVFTTPSLLLITIGASATSFAGYGFFQWTPSFLIRSQGLTEVAIATALAPVLLLGAIGAIAGGWMADRFGKKRASAYGLIPAIALLTCAPFLACALLTHNGAVSLAFIAVPALLNFLWIAPALAAMQNLAHAGIRATVAAIMAFFNNLIGFGLGPLAIGATSDALAGRLGEADGLRYALFIAALGYLVAGLIFLLVAYRLPRDLARRGEQGQA